MDVAQSALGAAVSVADLAGTPYIDVLKTFHRELRPQSYLEIGTSEGHSLAFVTCPTIAIDPEFRLHPDTVNDKPICAFYRMTSDHFFEHHNPQTILGGPLDMAFIDGMHRCEFILRDFINIERHCKRNSIIFMHDCVPVEILIAGREHRGLSVEPHRKGWWTGDVWRTLVALKNRRPDLRITVLDAYGTGLACVTNLDPASSSLTDDYDTIVEEMLTWSLDDIGLVELHRLLNVESTSVVDSYEKITRRFWL